MKTPIVLYQRSMAKVSYFRLIRFFFHATAVTKNHSKDRQRNGNNHGTDIIYRTVLSAGLQPYTLISQYEVGITVLYHLFYMKVTCHWPVSLPLEHSSGYPRPF